MRLQRMLDPRLDPKVFAGSAALIVPFVALGAVSPATLGRVSSAALSSLTGTWGPLYLASVSCFVAFSLAVALSPLGRIRLGPDGERPEFSLPSWFAMLFSAGMGIGLVFWSVGEPLTHFTHPPVGEPGTAASARLAFEIFYFHWGVHAWATYVIVGLALAYSQFRKGRPGLVSHCLVPLFGERRVRGTGGHLVDVLAIWATVMGVVTSLGLGALQIASGLADSAGLPRTEGVTLAVIAVITVAFIVSAATGVTRGIKFLSNFNVILMLVVLAAFLRWGPTGYLVGAFGQALLDYGRDLLPLSLRLTLFDNPQWTRTWTVFYWAWWIAWAPFVGAFIARISRGRTVREFILGVMLLPALFSFVFATALGGTAVHADLLEGARIGQVVAKNVEVGLFETLRRLPHYGLLAALANLLIASFFVTSADSATFVVCSFSTGGSQGAGRRLVVFWGLTLGTVAAVLVHAGGLDALQTASLVGAFPFIAVMALLAAATLKDLLSEARGRPSVEAVAPPDRT